MADRRRAACESRIGDVQVEVVQVRASGRYGEKCEKLNEMDISGGKVHVSKKTVLDVKLKQVRRSESTHAWDVVAQPKTP